jgi:hypothetical protein
VSDTTGTLELSEIGQAVIQVLKHQSVLNASLYISRTFCGRSADEISEQFRPSPDSASTMPPAEIDKRVAFVTAQIQNHLADRDLIPQDSYK